jgi:UDP-4-amino-4,6-dideoxy-N-acetyl-beta-L-altrosamine transaminase
MGLPEDEEIWYGRHDISQEDIDAVVEVLRSDFLTQGPTVPAFEEAVSAYCGAEYAIAVNSGTGALHIAMLALGVGPGDRIWTTPITFVASANCALYCGGTVDFVDIEPDTYNMSVECLEEKLIGAEKTGSLPKVVVPVHLAGQPCDMSGIYELSRKYGFEVVEDASHALGGRYRGDLIGSGRFSAMTVFSFHPVKMITCAEGGMVVTNDEKLAKRLRIFRSHGITSTANEMQARPRDEIWNYQQVSLGFNYRMTDVQAALGLSQLGRLNDFVTKRRRVALLYDRSLLELPVVVPFQHDNSFSSYHLYLIKLVVGDDKHAHRRVYAALRSEGILVNLHYIPVYLQPYFEKMGFRRGYCPVAEEYFAGGLSIPIYPGLLEEQQRRVVDALRRALMR